MNKKQKGLELAQHIADINTAWMRAALFIEGNDVDLDPEIYPFDKCFSELLDNMYRWQEKIVDAAKSIELPDVLNGLNSDGTVSDQFNQDCRKVEQFFKHQVMLKSVSVQKLSYSFGVIDAAVAQFYVEGYEDNIITMTHINTVGCAWYTIKGVSRGGMEGEDLDRVLQAIEKEALFNVQNLTDEIESIQENIYFYSAVLRGRL